MHPVEIQDALDNSVVWVDTREQPTPRFRERLRQIGLPIERKALPFGDYSIKAPLPGGGWLDLSDSVAVERKMGADELCQCYTYDRARFEREFERVKSADAKLYLLVENTTYEMLFGGKYKSKMKPKALIASLFAYTARYNCVPILCREQTGGLIIREVLLRELKERLTAIE